MLADSAASNRECASGDSGSFSTSPRVLPERLKACITFLRIKNTFQQKLHMTEGLKLKS